MKRFLLSTLTFIGLSIFAITAVNAQTQTVKGTVTDAQGGEPLISATVVIEGASTGVVTDLDGNFSIELDLSEPKVLVISYLGYNPKEVVVTNTTKNLDVQLETMVIPGQEVVVTGSRIGETILESPAAIQKMNPREVKEVASGDFYEGLGTMAGVDITTSSMGFKVINMRGFNTTAPVRVVQFIDGMDNQAPGLNFPVGNLVGANDLDVHSVEVITGPASALYGPNAFQGVVSIKTKNPWDYQGLSVQLRGGSRNMFDGQVRYATTFGKNDNWAVKVTGGFSRADDWIADDDTANLYGNLETDVNLSSIVEQLQYDEELTQEERDDFIALNNYLGLVSPNAYPGTITVESPGYQEQELSDNTTQSIKMSGELRHKFKDNSEISYVGKFGTGTAIYQASNRYSINDIVFHQHKLEYNTKRLTAKAYTTIENAGNSYDIVFTGINLSKEGIANYVSEYLGHYFDTLGDMSNDFDDDVSAEEVAAAHAFAAANVDSAWIEPGTAEFDSLRNEIVNNSDLESGSKFTDASKLYHAEAQYNFDFEPVDLIAGANFRYYDPQSYGTIFRDTLINPSDTLDNGSADLDADFVNLNVWEVGGFAQASKKFFNDKLKLMASIRVDKNQNFDPMYSPRFAVMFNQGKHHFRISGQQAFRLPTLQNQYILLDVGPLTIAGNLNGWENLYTLESIEDFDDTYEATNGDVDQSLTQLDRVQYDPIRPEQVKTLEVGYRGSVGKLYIDATAYMNIYTDFIGEIRVVQANTLKNGEGDLSEEQVTEAMENSVITSTGNTKYYTRYQIPVNAAQEVTSWGATLGLAYYINSKYSAKANYSYNSLDTSNLTDPIIPAFNTPEHKFNIGFTGRRVWKNFGFSTNFKWVDGFRWESTFGDGDVPAYHILDLQLSYEMTQYNSTVRVGSSNLLNNERREAYGAPTIGRMFYVTWLFEIQ